MWLRAFIQKEFSNNFHHIFLQTKAAKFYRTGKFVDFYMKKDYNFTERENLEQHFEN